MSSKIVKTLIVLAGAVLGSFVSKLTASVSFLSWLSYGGTFGLSTSSPMVIDLDVVQLTFGLTFHVTVAVILFLFLAILFVRKV